MRLLAHQFIIVRMRSDPEPCNATVVRSIQADDPMMETHATAPKTPNLLEMERRMSWVGFEQLELVVGQPEPVNENETVSHRI
jgi:hypothetical protein